MKRFFAVLAIALTALLAFSCATKSDIDNLQDQIDGLKTGKIASIEEQIANINSTISGLGDIDDRITALKNELKKYVDDELSKEKDWVKATFATLSQYQSVLGELESIRQSIIATTGVSKAELEKAINDAEESMKGWVSSQLSGYYTIAQLDAKLGALSNADASMQSSISTLENSLVSAKSELMAAYSKAIADAITAYDGTITAKIAADIKNATDILEARISALESRISALEGMIQSITVIPAYTDGSVSASPSGMVSFSFMMTPLSALNEISSNSLNILVAPVATKAAANPGVVKSTYFSTDFSTGRVDVTANLISFFPVEDGLAIAVNIKHGKNDFISSFVNVHFTPLGEPEYVDLGLPSGTLWATSNIGSARPEDSGFYFSWGNTTGYVYEAQNTTCKWYIAPGFEGAGTVLDNGIYEGLYNSSTGAGLNSDIPENPAYDAARAILGSGWRMPTRDEFTELIQNTTARWDYCYGDIPTCGVILTSKQAGFTDKSIFFPAAGLASYNYCPSQDSNFYWSSTLSTYESGFAYGLSFAEGSDDCYAPASASRSFGVPIRPVKCESMDHTGVRLWEDGPLWATENIGAGRPQDYGDYFAWGAVAAQAEYSASNYRFFDDNNDVTKYCTDSFYGDVDDIDVLEAEDDAASVIWGGNWRIPTAQDWDDLMSHCSLEWTSNYNSTGIAGCLVKGNESGYTDKSIFLPASGFRDNTANAVGSESIGCYWSSSLDTDNNLKAAYLGFSSSDIYVYNDARSYGRSIRPVSD